MLNIIIKMGIGDWNENLVETKAHDAGEAATRLSKIYKEEGDDTKAREYEKLAQSFGYKVTK